MPVDHPPHSGAPGSRGLRQGVVNALLVAIPLWACIGTGIVLLYLERPLTGVEGVVLTFAAIVELILLRLSRRTLRPLIQYRELLARAGAGAPVARQPLLKQTALLTGLVGAYLHYYFWDVQLQIASLHSVTVFVPAAALG